MQIVLTRSRARWIGEGEKVTNYFCNLAKRHCTSKIIRTIEKMDGTFLAEQVVIVRETKVFYENLYKQEDQIIDDKIIDVDLEEINKE